MRRVPAVGDEFGMHWSGYLVGNTFDLGRGSIRIIFTLENEDRTCNFRKVFLNIPVGKFRRQPPVGPPVENRLRLFFMIPDKLFF
jgi:hypothetical protein